ncbi:hypothetical protein PVAP13_8NG211903 [Panicum virgatum]|uniref:Uncharacterized protein n=1 Tax=Panicum virgatum TaxID=38727 RepID=A0A8T0P9R3_PANVG|nr:hypothetical protein PVAP13_8NG211903 [Panicum virgatum]
MTNTLTIVLICFLIRNLSYYTPQKPETSPLLATNRASSRENILSFSSLHLYQKEALYQFLFLSCPLCPHLALLLKKMMNLMRRFHWLFHYTPMQMMIRAKKLKVVQRSLLHQGLLRLGTLR